MGGKEEGREGEGGACGRGDKGRVLRGERREVLECVRKKGGEERGAVFMPVRRVGKEGSGVHAEAGGGRREGEAGTCKQAC